ncbi:hypothetical protein ABEW05_005595 [Botrytis cinerea]
MVRFHRPRSVKREAEDIARLEHGRGWRYVEIHLENQYLLRSYNSRKALISQIWVQVRARHEYILSSLGFDQEDINYDLAILSVGSDPEHVASIEKRNAEILAEIAARYAKKVAKFENSINQKQCVAEQSEKLSVPTRSKVKTRKLPKADDQKNSVEAVSGLSATPVSSAASPSPKVLVRKSSYVIFQSMFPTPNFEERTNTVPWDSLLVNTMPDAGFLAI